MISCILWKDNWIIFYCFFMVWYVEIYFSDWLPLKARKPNLLCYLYSSLEENYISEKPSASKLPELELGSMIALSTPTSIITGAHAIRITVWITTFGDDECSHLECSFREGISICDPQQNVPVEMLNPWLIFKFVTTRH